MRRCHYAWFALRILANAIYVSSFAPPELGRVASRHQRLTSAKTSLLWLAAEPKEESNESFRVDENTSSSSNSVDENTSSSTGSEKKKKEKEKVLKEQVRTLYHVLGASPTDTHAVLRSKYTTLARQMHPDAAANTQNATAFSEVAAAWSVLGDPKERMRYDRSLKAAAFTENVEVLLEASIRNAVPFFFKTANATRAAVKTSSKTMQDVGQRIEFARDLLDLDLQRREYLQQAASQDAKRKQLKWQLDTLDETRLSSLKENSKLTLMEALRILEGFRDESSVKEPPAEISELEQVEVDYKEKMRLRQNRQQALRNAERDEANAIKREEEALRRLEEAQRKLEMARKTTEETKVQAKTAMQQEKSAAVELNKAFISLEKGREQVCTSLRKKEDEYLKRKAANLSEECDRLTEEAKMMRSKAEKIKLESEELKKREEESRNQK